MGINTEVGARIRELRAAGDMSREELARASGVPLARLRQVEEGKEDLDLEDLERLLPVLGVTARQFFDSPLFR